MKDFIVAADEPGEKTGWIDWETLIADASTDAPVSPERDENDTVSIKSLGFLLAWAVCTATFNAPPPVGAFS